MKVTKKMIESAQFVHRRMLDKSAWMPADEMRAVIEAALAAAPPTLAPPPAPAVPDDWVLVPREPTREMVASAVRDCGGIGGGSVGERQSVDGDDMRAVWDTMIAAAPPPPQQGETR